MKARNIGVGVLVGFTLITTVSMGMVCVVELPFWIMFGWAAYLERVVPQIHVNLTQMGLGVACLGAGLALAHQTASWFWQQTKRDRTPATPGQKRWTIMGVGLIVLMFLCGIAAVGMVHQAAWLATSPQPLAENNYRLRGGANAAKCSSNLMQLGRGILLYANAHDDRLPDSLEELVLPENGCDLAAGVLVCPATATLSFRGPATRGNLKPIPCSYVYYGRGLRLPLPGNRPLAAELMANHAGKIMNILFADGHVLSLSPQEAEVALRRLDDPLPGQDRTH